MTVAGRRWERSTTAIRCARRVGPSVVDDRRDATSTHASTTGTRPGATSGTADATTSEASSTLKPYLLVRPGPLRDLQVSAVLSGEKVSTTGLLAEDEAEGEDLPSPGERDALIESAGRTTAEPEVTEVRVLPLGEVDLRHALDEGEGHRSVAERARPTHVSGRGADARGAGCPRLHRRRTTVVVAERFRVVRHPDRAEAPSSGSRPCGTAPAADGGR